MQILCILLIASNFAQVGHIEGDAAILEVYVYNDVEDALYIHHDVLLPSFPMAIEWMGLERGTDSDLNIE